MRTRGSKNKSNYRKKLEKISKEYVSFKDLLYLLRTNEKMSQAELAEKAKVTKDCVRDLEKGLKPPSMEVSSKLAKALGQDEAVFVSKIIEDKLLSPLD